MAFPLDFSTAVCQYIGMVCIYCGTALAVTNSRSQKQLNQTWRRRQCSECGAIFTSLEGIDHSKALAVEYANKKLRPFQRDKLFVSILKSCEHRQDALQVAGALTNTAVAKIIEGVESGLVRPGSIAQQVLNILRRYDTAAAVHYEAYHRAALKLAND